MCKKLAQFLHVCAYPNLATFIQSMQENGFLQILSCKIFDFLASFLQENVHFTCNLQDFASFLQDICKSIHALQVQDLASHFSLGYFQNNYYNLERG